MFLAGDDDTLYRALITRDRSYDGFVFVGVTTTGIFCRLTCPARKPKRTNVVFFSSLAAAQGAGFRPCLRCKPLEANPSSSAAFAKIKERVSAEPDRRWTNEDLRTLGYDPSTVRRAFQREYGITFVQYARAQRLGLALSKLREGGSVLDAQLDASYESASGFREAITKLIGDPPARANSRSVLTAQWIDTPLGAMLAIADTEGLHLLEFADRKALPTEIARLRKRSGAIYFGRSELLGRTADELQAYFSGDLRSFGVPIAQRGSAFELDVWQALGSIPLGESRSYSQIAESMGRDGAARAVARANGANQVAIIVPCHRVIGSDGALRGYGGKIWRKQWLLEHERRTAANLVQP